MIPDAPSDPEPRQVIVREHPLHYTDVGEGPIVVAIPGLPGDVTDFRWLGTALEPHVRFIRLSLPGFGGSSPRISHFRWPEPARVVAETLDALDLQDVTLLGHSYGTLIANYASQLATERVRRIAFLAPMGLRRNMGFDPMNGSKIASPLLKVRLFRRLLVPQIRRGFRKAGFKKHLEEEHICRTMEAVSSWSFEAYPEITANLNIPVFGAYCEDDHLIEAEIMAEFLAACPDGPRLVFSTGGHNPQKTQAIEVAEALTDWLKKEGCTAP